MATHRQFSPELETLAADWASKSESTLAWQDRGPFAQTESRPFKVEYNGLVGVAKPGERKTDGIARAAHEKIASDLAFVLGLPVPPVILWDRGVSPAEQFVSISAWAFPQPLTWDQAQAALTDVHKRTASPIVSAMLAFETWISAQDRKSDHTLVSLGNDGHLRLAFIDYAYSLSYGWRGVNDHAGASPAYMPVPKDDIALARVADAVAALPVDQIEGIVRRISNNYLTIEKKEVIIGNLLSRKVRVRQLLGV